LILSALVGIARGARNAPNPRVAERIYQLEPRECEALADASLLRLYAASFRGVRLRYAPLPAGGGLDAYLLGPQALRR